MECGPAVELTTCVGKGMLQLLVKDSRVHSTLAEYIRGKGFLQFKSHMFTNLTAKCTKELLDAALVTADWRSYQVYLPYIYAPIL
jgi:hypothetical protein